MSTGRSRRPRKSAGLVAGLLAAGLLSACSGTTDDPEPGISLPSSTAPTTSDPTPTTPPGEDVTKLPQAVIADVAGEIQRVLENRSAGLRSGDPDRFLANLVPDVDLRVVQRGYFDNLAQLPLTEFQQRLMPASLVRQGNAYWGVVETFMRLGPYDKWPVRTLDRFRFVPWRGTTFRIASTTDRAWEEVNRPLQQPWDLEPVRVRQGSSVVGVFDDGTVDRSAELVDAVERGLADVSARVPYDWTRNVVFYALSDPSFLASFDNLPGGDPQALDAVAFTVPSGPDDPVVAATRFLLTPEALARSGTGDDGLAALDRLVRHELTHIAVGKHDDEAPIWLSEGIAEWLSVQVLPPDQRQVPARALDLARSGKVVMPGDESFNDDAADVHYAIAWWVCEWIAQSFGEQSLWGFLDGFTTLKDTDDDAVVRQVLHMSPDELAQRGAALMLATYEPTPTETPTSTDSPTATPTDGATTVG